MRYPLQTCLVSLLAVAVPGVAGCSVPFTGPDPAAAADRVARALATGTLSTADFAGDGAARAQQEYDAAVGDLDTYSAMVEAGPVKTSGDEAEVPLVWHWRLPEETWSYATTLRLRKGEGSDGTAWLPRWSPTLVEPSLRAGESMSLVGLQAERGEVTGARDQAIVRERPVYRIGVDKVKVPAGDAATSARRLAALVGVAPQPFVRAVTAAGPRAFVPAIVRRRESVPGPLLGRINDVKGAVALADDAPLAPSKEFASALLGSVGPATAEIVEASDGAVRAGDEVGLTGLQKRYDQQLRGTRGFAVVAAADGGGRRRLLERAPKDGRTLATTLDVRLQDAAQHALAGIGPASALVAIRPSTGDLLAVGQGAGPQGLPTATFGRFAPGSTFKVVSSLALLRAGLSPTSRVTCPPTVTVDGRAFANYSDYPADRFGKITLADALAFSCNTAFIGQRARVSAGDLQDAAAALGLGVDGSLGFPAFLGEVPDPSGATDAAAALIGQGTVLASPMAMATVAASVARGARVVPRLLRDRTVTGARPARPLGPREAADLREMMRGVVERGSADFLRDVPGPPVLAKTGTAEYGAESPPRTHTWMIAAQGDLAVAVFVETGQSGSATAGPPLEAFLRAARS